MFDKLQDVERRFVEIEESLSQGELGAKEIMDLTKERSSIEPLVEKFRQFSQLNTELKDAEEMLSSDDPEMVEMAKEEIGEIKSQIDSVSAELKILLLPKDPRDGRNVILEVRAGTGGDEAALFCGDLFRMYGRHCERKRWRIEMLSATESEKGGFKEVVALVTGDGAFSQLKYEMGVHRVQRVPETESQGRIHTSACTVAVLPEAEDVEVDINPADLDITTSRASGAGGQHINKTDSAIRIVHKPTGLVVECQDERSQHKNKEKALKVLKSRLFEKMEQEAAAERSADRRSQVGSGDRSERIRTYNFPQGRMTDHRINLTLYKLDAIMEGDLDEVFEALHAHYTAEMLQAQDSGLS